MKTWQPVLFFVPGKGSCSKGRDGEVLLSPLDQEKNIYE